MLPREITDRLCTCASWKAIIIFFMFLAGVNFTLHYMALRGRMGAYFKNSEFLVYLGILAVVSFSIFLDLRLRAYGDTGHCARDAAFQTVSILTTTGYATADYDQWSYFARFMLLFLMFIGGCAGSTGGGIKCIRIMLLYKYVQQELRKIIHPHAVVAVKLGDQNISQSVLNGILGMVILFIVIFVLASIAISFLGLDIITSISAVAATLGNIGPGLGLVGPAENYAHIPSIGKGILIFCMLAGRLEVYTIVILLFPEFWRK